MHGPIPAALRALHDATTQALRHTHAAFVCPPDDGDPSAADTAAADSGFLAPLRAFVQAYAEAAEDPSHSPNPRAKSRFHAHALARPIAMRYNRRKNVMQIDADKRVAWQSECSMVGPPATGPPRHQMGRDPHRGPPAPHPSHTHIQK